MARILLIEDQTTIQTLVKSVLTGHEMIVAGTIEEARAQMTKDFELVLLDVHLPDGDGFSFFVELQPVAIAKNVPVLFLTARSEVSDRVTGYTLGADDYITKPLDPVEFRARVESKLRRRHFSQTAEAVYRRDDMIFSLTKQTVTLENGNVSKVLELTTLEFKLLLHLVKHKDHVFSREALITAVWGDNLNVSDRTVDSHVSHLRKHLAGSAVNIQSVYGEGYKLTGSKMAA